MRSKQAKCWCEGVKLEQESYSVTVKPETSEQFTASLCSKWSCIMTLCQCICNVSYMMYSPDNNIEVKLERESSSVMVQPEASKNVTASLSLILGNSLSFRTSRWASIGYTSLCVHCCCIIFILTL